MACEKDEKISNPIGEVFGLKRMSTKTRLRARQNVVTSLLTVAIVVVFIAYQAFFPSRLLAGVGTINSFRGAHELEKEDTRSTFHWHDIKPSKHLKYTECFNDLQCARLEVPLGWNRADGKGRQIALAVIRRPARVPVTDPRYGGAVVIEPGGPGGSGVYLQHWLGSNIQFVVDSSADPNLSSSEGSTDKYFDVIGFDPQGVNNSEPVTGCFPDSFSREVWNLQQEAAGILGSSDDALRINWRRQRALSIGCSDALTRMVDGEAIGEHVNTTPVIRDIVEIIERHAEWREQKGLEAQAAHGLALARDRLQAIVERTRWNKGEEKLLYWGFSYGTIIGETFAAMYPERVGRVVLDGVCDADDYYHGTWSNNLWDADNVLHQFFSYCAQAGPVQCAFHRSGGIPEIESTFNKLLSAIYDDPISVPSSAERGPELITWTDIKLMLAPSLYQPLRSFPIAAQLLQDLVAGNGSKFADFKDSQRTPFCQSESCLQSGPYSYECVNNGWDGVDTSWAILCTDGADLGDTNEKDFGTYWKSLRAQSAALGEVWAHTRLGCVGWNAQAKWKYDGPFSSNETAYPILFIGNTFDPVTPVRNARKMSERYSGSVVLEHGAEGHCSFTAPSTCTGNVVRSYFQTGEMPEVGTVCNTDVKPLIGRVLSDSALDIAVTDAEVKLSQVLAEGSRTFGEQWAGWNMRRPAIGY